MRMLIDAGADVNSVSAKTRTRTKWCDHLGGFDSKVEGETPLFAACDALNESSARMLLEAGADVNKATTNIGETPLYVVCTQAYSAQIQVPVARMLVGAGADVHTATTDKGWTPLYIACCTAREDAQDAVVQLLLEAGANPNTVTIDTSETPLFVACLGCHEEIVRMLIGAGADVNTPAGNGWAPFSHACWAGNTAIVRLLLEGGANMDAMAPPTLTAAELAFTPLHLACIKGHPTVVRMLLDAGADQNKAAEDGLLPVDWAAIRKQLPIVEMLVRKSAPRGAERSIEEKKHWVVHAMRNLKQAATGEARPVPLAITVQRSELLEGLCGLLEQSFMRGIAVTFHGESGTGDALHREYLTLVTREFVDPDRCLLVTQTTEGEHAHRVQPTPWSGVNPDHLSYFEMLGKLVGVGLMQNTCVPVRFTMPFLKQLIGLPMVPEDLRAVDPNLYSNKVELVEKCTEEELEGLGLTFEEEVHAFAFCPGNSPTTVNLPSRHPGQTPVALANRKDYVNALVQYRLVEQIAEQTAAVKRGLVQVVTQPLLDAMATCLSPAELDTLIAGKEVIDLDDWQRNTEYVHYTAESDQVRWFWNAMRGYSQEFLRKALHFFTGSEAVGVGGFSQLPGFNGAIQRFKIQRVQAPSTVPPEDSSVPRRVFPFIHACFNTLSLPEYTTEVELVKKLQRAIEEGRELFDEQAVAS
eukprot:g1441.t1